MKKIVVTFTSISEFWRFVTRPGSFSLAELDVHEAGADKPVARRTRGKGKGKTKSSS